MAVDYRSYRVIRKSPRYEDNVASEILEMREKVAVYMKDQALNGKDSILAINFLTQFKGACDSSAIREGTAVWSFKDMVNGLALAAFQALLIFSSNDENRYERSFSLMSRWGKAF